MDPLFITNYVLINVLDAISRTPGVGQANLFSKLNYSMRVWFDTDRLVSLNLSPGDMIAAIQAQNVLHRSGGSARARSAPTSNSSSTCRPRAGWSRPNSSATSCIRANPDGSVLRVPTSRGWNWARRTWTARAG